MNFDQARQLAHSAGNGAGAFVRFKRPGESAWTVGCIVKSDPPFLVVELVVGVLWRHEQIGYAEAELLTVPAPLKIFFRELKRSHESHCEFLREQIKVLDGFLGMPETP